MNFGFTEDQELIRKSARDFVQGESSMERIRALRDDEIGYSKDLWRQMADAGWLGAVYPEEYDGLGLNYADLICIEEEFGKGLMPEPLITTVILAGNAVLLGDSEEQKKDLLPKIAAGELTMTLAAYELEGRYNIAHCATTADETDAGYTLNGAKAFVPDAASSDKILVTARVHGDTVEEDGIALFVVDAGAPGLTLTPLSTMDRRKRYTLTLKDVSVPADALIADPSTAYGVVEKAVDRATVALCAEMVGGMEEALQRTITYCQERVQFGKPIGSFQVVKHKAADMYLTLEMARSAMYYAAMAIDENHLDLREAVSTAKALCSDGYIHIGKEAIQLHGGIGFTDEHDIQFFYKRAIVTNATFGDATYHRERFAQQKAFGGKSTRHHELSAALLA